MPTKDEITVDNAVSIIRKDYYDDVKGVAQELIDETKTDYKEGTRGEELRENLLERIHEIIDSQQRVMYTFQAQLGMLVSENSGAYIEEYGIENATMEDDLNWSALMFAAMERDVMEELDHMGFDVNEPEDYFEEEE